jgi:hypothetical protein
MKTKKREGPLEGVLPFSSAAATAAAATATFVAVAYQQNGDDDQPNGVILKETAEAVIHDHILRC